MTELHRPRYVALFAAESRSLLALGRRTTELWRAERDDPGAGVELFRILHTLKGMAAALAFEELAGRVHEVETALGEVRDGTRPADLAWFRVIERELDALATMCEVLIAAETGGGDAPAAPASVQADSEAIVRVEQGRLDALVADLGSLVTARQELERHAVGNIAPVARAAMSMARRLDAVQDRILQVRLAPLGEVLDRIPPMVRDLARQLGKEVTVEVQGEALEVDRGILSTLPDPLMHLLRNAVDHGLESPEVRRRAGKRLAGRISINARRERDSILLELSDDGAGIDRERIAERERAAGRLDPGAMLSDDGLLAVLARPGFSTAEQVTDVSGRGVGLDVVLSRLHQVGASLSLTTVAGRGTAFTIRLPLRLGIVRALVTALGDERYVLPIAQVAELVAWQAESAVRVDGRLMLTVREESLPVLDLRRLLLHRGAPPPSHRPVVVLEANGQRIALLADRVLGQVEAVVQPVDRLQGMPRWMVGAAILDDGHPAMMLDLASVV
ncbi:MAG: chemotaxis protein CheW [Gemmatimonadales bacterium]|nr:chemotaxis protein CheW [Gemmatimonadales bacterium]